MDLKIPNIVKPIALKDYAEEFGDAVIWVWVNPTRALRIAWKSDMDEVQTCAWLSEMWSQGPEGTHFNPEDVKKFGDSCMEQDPQLWVWVIGETVGLMFAHLGAKKKTLTTPLSN